MSEENIFRIQINDQIYRLRKDTLPQILFRFFEKVVEQKFDLYSGIYGNIKDFEKQAELNIKQGISIIENPGFLKRNKELKGSYTVRFKVKFNKQPVRNISELNLNKDKYLDEQLEFEFIGFRYFGTNHERVIKANKELKQVFSLSKNNWSEGFL